MAFARMHDVLLAGGGSFTPSVFAGQEVQAAIWSALDESGKWHKRHCPLQAPVVVSAILMMSIFRSCSIVNAFKHVLDAVRGDEDCGLSDITPEALYHARSRLGFEPLRLLALGIACREQPARSFLGLVPCAMDGVKMRLPDFPENEAEFGRPPASRGSTAFPQLTGVSLIYTDSRMMMDCVWGRWNLSELAAAEVLLSNLGPEHVVFLDRRYTKADLWFKFLEREAHIVHRLSATYKPKHRKRLGQGDWLIDVGHWVEIPPEERTGQKKWRWESRTLRLVEYQVGEDGERVRLLTDLLDPDRYPARELALGYHLRWEIELAYDEVKTHLSTVQHGTQHTTFRSQTPKGVYQEAWGLIAAYNLVRGLMADAAAAAGVPPLEISFVDSLEVIRMALPRLHSCRPRQRNRLYSRLLRDIADCRLDRPRRKRHAPRVVKVKMSNFKLKQKRHRSTQRDFAAELRLVDAVHEA